MPTTAIAAPARAGVAYSSPRKTAGTRPASTSRAIPPPMPVTMPIRAAGSGVRSKSRALSAPVTQKSASPNASKMLTCRSIRPRAGWKHERDQPGGDRDQQVAPVLERGGRRGADQHVAQEPAAETGRAGQDQHAEDVEALADADQGAGDREHEDADQVQHDQGGGRFGLHVARRY